MFTTECQQCRGDFGRVTPLSLCAPCWLKHVGNSPQARRALAEWMALVHGRKYESIDKAGKSPFKGEPGKPVPPRLDAKRSSRRERRVKDYKPGLKRPLIPGPHAEMVAAQWRK